jgi:CheY-like chemotaxis protein
MLENGRSELATQIEANRELQDTPIIFLTPPVTRGEAKSGLHIQGHPLVAKPINIPEFIDAIEKYLPRSVLAGAFTRGEIMLGKIPRHAQAPLQL